MNPFIQFKTTVPNNLTVRSPSRRSLLLIPLTLVLVCFTLSPAARAACQEGCLTSSNTVLGEDALFSLTNGEGNTAVGFQALLLNTFGIFNTAIGNNALRDNTGGGRNTATGSSALLHNTTGSSNTATGVGALRDNTEGRFNTATGQEALSSNTTGIANTATGESALRHNTDGLDNTASGTNALVSNTTGIENTAIGSAALPDNTTGANNIALGVLAGQNLTTGDNNIDIGHKGAAGESNTIRIGTVKLGGIVGRGKALPIVLTRTFIAGISGVPVTGSPVHVRSDGQLGVPASSERFKAEIKPMDKASEAIHALKPVTFRYKEDLDPEGIPQFGLVAEDVAKVNPDLVVREADDKVYSVRYEAVNAMLLNEFLKEHQKVQKLEAALAAVNERLKEQDAKIDKVNAKVELTKPAPQVANNGQ
jgi:Chaperone of endosialidase